MEIKASKSEVKEKFSDHFAVVVITMMNIIMRIGTRMTTNIMWKIRLKMLTVSFLKICSVKVNNNHVISVN